MSQVRTVKCQKLYKKVGEFGLNISPDRTQLRTDSSKSLEGTWKKSNHFVLVLLMRQSRSVSLKDYKVYSYSQEEQHITPVEQWRRWNEYKVWVEENSMKFRQHKKIPPKQCWKALNKWTVVWVTLFTI